MCLANSDFYLPSVNRKLRPDVSLQPAKVDPVRDPGPGVPLRQDHQARVVRCRGRRVRFQRRHHRHLKVSPGWFRFSTQPELS